MSAGCKCDSLALVYEEEQRQYGSLIAATLAAAVAARREQPEESKQSVAAAIDLSFDGGTPKLLYNTYKHTHRPGH